MGAGHGNRYEFTAHASGFVTPATFAKRVAHLPDTVAVTCPERQHTVANETLAEPRQWQCVSATVSSPAAHASFSSSYPTAAASPFGG